jgi:hypothetical protein
MNDTSSPNHASEDANSSNERDFPPDSRLGRPDTAEDGDVEESGDATHRKKKQRTEKVNRVPTIVGFDLEMDTSRVTIPPSDEGISEFNEYDVLSGRGGGTNVHPGNRDFRDLINKYRTVYLKAKKNDKPSISRAIVKEIRSKGGRFLKKEEKGHLYYEIGDIQAREKTSQALRQRAPEIRKLMFEREGHLPGAPGRGIPGASEGLGITSPQQQLLSGSTGGMGHLNGMPMLASTTIHPNFAAGLHAGMEFHRPSMMGAGQLMGATGYNTAIYQAMMAGMGAGMGNIIMAGGHPSGAPDESHAETIVHGGQDQQPTHQAEGSLANVDKTIV